VQPLNADVPIVVTSSGMIIEVRAVQLLKVLLAIDKSPEGSITDERDVQPVKIRSFKIVIEVGIEIDLREVQPRNTLSAKVWSPEGRTIDEN
jgi:hypothetical protein